jgi:putative SOS response-associated peptidase YedK
MTLTRSAREIAEYFDLMETGESRAASLVVRPRYNLTPSQDVAAIVADTEGHRRLEWKKWGLVPSWSKDPGIGARLFNARSETADSKPSFRSAWKKRRCLIAADGFYEWTPRNRGHQPFHFRPRDGVVLGLAGLHEEWHGVGGEVLASCTVLTTDANPDLEGVHHRMPVILAPAVFAAWLDPASDPGSLKAMTVPAPAGTLARRAVSKYVNDPRHDDPGCLRSDAPAESAEQADLFGSSGGRDA